VQYNIVIFSTKPFVSKLLTWSIIINLLMYIFYK
jgi:hypothetical protein